MTPGLRSDALLVVEDDPDDLHFLTRAFRKTDSPVPMRVARNGQEAIDYLVTEGLRDRLLAVLLDLKLPVRSGFEVLSHIKTDPHLRATPVVILTSSAETLDLRQAYDLGANSYLVKPAGSQAMLELMSSVERYWLRHNWIA